MPLKFYQPEGVVHDSLEAAIATGQSFVAATDDHEFAMFIDWAEYDDEDRARLLEVTEMDPEEQEREFVKACTTDDDLDIALGGGEKSRRMELEDALLTIMNWQIKHTPEGDSR